MFVGFFSNVYSIRICIHIYVLYKLHVSTEINMKKSNIPPYYFADVPVTGKTKRVYKTVPLKSWKRVVTPGAGNCATFCEGDGRRGWFVRSHRQFKNAFFRSYKYAWAVKRGTGTLFVAVGSGRSSCLVPVKPGVAIAHVFRVSHMPLVNF